ncbi:PHD finger protein 20 isoform X2 [Xenopus laevis]|uniref:PHD finger protein 20 n=2 Tax=Xenopus laevis TaxID=8355 RepID=A0A8J0TSA8_XENLA|nr:PHD finger protein 20 isoform X2 [Xenopus laevis]
MWGIQVFRYVQLNGFLDVLWIISNYKMKKHPPNRRGISFEIGGQLEARDRLKKWYAAHIEEIDYEEGKVLIHFKRWNHRYDEWFCWDSPYLRPLEKIQLRREGLVEEEPQVAFRVNEQVLACWSDCRFYPAKIVSANKDGTYTVKFFDGVVQTVKNIHVKAFSKDQENGPRPKTKEKCRDGTSPSDKYRVKFKEQRKSAENTNPDKEKTVASKKKTSQLIKEKKPIVHEKSKIPEKNVVKNEKEDKENISENERESSGDCLQEESSTPSETLRTPLENGERRKKRDRSTTALPSDSVSQTLQPETLELRRRKISIGSDIPTKRSRLDKSTKKRVPISENVKVENGLPKEQHPETEEICETEDILSPLSLSLCESQEKLTGNEEKTAPSTVEEGASQEPKVTSMETQEVHTESFTPSNPEQIEVKKPPETDDLVEPIVTDVPSSTPDRKAEENHSTEKNQIQDVSSASVAHALKKSDDPAPKAVTMELDPNRFKCKFLDCSKSFRKAKLLHYHMKYFHGIEKAEQDQSPVTRQMQTRGSLAHEKSSQGTPKRRRTTSGSLHTPLQISLRSSPQDGKAERLGEKRRHSMHASYTSNSYRPSLKEKSKEENQIQKTHSKSDKPSKSVKDKEKIREKLKDSLNLKAKKKKKKKKKCKLEISGSEENLDISQELSPKKTQVIKQSPDLKPSCQVKSAPMRSSDHGRRRDIGSISDEDTLSDSCTENLLWSDDDDYNEEIDVTNGDEELEEEPGNCELVRCMCQVQDENDFMIQCEECLCWQHGVCMGLLEDKVPEKYKCYICQNPPGQRLSLKYWYDKDWLDKGHMHGLSCLEENYSHQNARKIVATHQLLGDVQRVIEVLHGLQLKMSILQSKEHPDLKFWGQPWKQQAANDKCYIRRIGEENSCKGDSTIHRTYNGAVDKPSPIPSMEESYIMSEHCYQKPRTYYPAVEQRLVVETRSSALDGGVERIRQNREDSIAERLGWELDRELIKTESEAKHNYCKVRECLSKRNPPQEVTHSPPIDISDGGISSQIQWQLNLLAHLESLQDEVTHRMDFIEKELDVLESFLDYTGELEPPEPLARLPQLKHRIKQLLTDLSKVEQIALYCST